jgi:hypothetical protein
MRQKANESSKIKVNQGRNLSRISELAKNFAAW